MSPLFHAAVGLTRSLRYIQWVADCPAHNTPVKAEVHIFNPLFDTVNPDANPDGFLAAINPSSEEVFSGAMLETGFMEVKQRAPWPEKVGEAGLAHGGLRAETVRFQGMRVAYFCLESDSTDERVVLNRIVTLKEDAGKADKANKRAKPGANGASKSS